MTFTTLEKDEGNRPIKITLLSQRGADGFSGLQKRLPNNTLNQGDIEFGFDPSDDSDVVLVQNYLKYDQTLTARAGYFWKWDNEPIVRRPFARGLDRIFTHEAAAGDNRVITAPPVLDWWIDKSFDELVALTPPPKPKRVSAIASTKTSIEGHRKRADFIDYLEGADVEVDLFGEGRAATLNDKWDGLAPYKYSIAIENTSKNDYWTEKIADCFLAYTVPIYFGATNISEYFPEGSYIWLPIDDQKQAIETIKAAIEADDWEKRLPALTEARRRILFEYSFAAQVMGRTRSEMSAILNSPRETRTVQGRRIRPGGWVRGKGIVENLGIQFKKFLARL